MFNLLIKIIFFKKTSKYVRSRINAEPSMSDIFIYCLYLELLGLTWEKAQKTNFDVFLWSWIQYFRTGDAILDSCGQLIDHDYIEKVLIKAKNSRQFPYVSKDYLFKKGVTSAMLHSIKAHLMDKDSEKNDVEVIIRFVSNHSALLDNVLVISDQEKRMLINVFIDASCKMLESYLLEKKYGAFISYKKAYLVLRLKTTGYANVLFEGYKCFSDSNNRRSLNNLVFVGSTLVFGQLIDDIIDLKRDFGKQINIFVSISLTYFPREFDQLRNMIQYSANLFNLIMKMPRTWLFMSRLICNFFFRMFIKRPLFSILILAGSTVIMCRKSLK